MYFFIFIHAKCLENIKEDLKITVSTPKWGALHFKNFAKASKFFKNQEKHFLIYFFQSCFSV